MYIIRELINPCNILAIKKGKYFTFFFCKIFIICECTDNPPNDNKKVEITNFVFMFIFIMDKYFKPVVISNMPVINI